MAVGGMVVRLGLGFGGGGDRVGGLIYLRDVPIPFSTALVLRIRFLRIGGGVGCVGVEERCDIVEFPRRFFRLRVWRLRVLRCGGIGRYIVVGC